ncbi:hypothetical protein KM043_007714 [Ampulex compressa]|nr:hypothetical protein KM043_007714 [Ampulex compressa]
MDDLAGLEITAADLELVYSIPRHSSHRGQLTLPQDQRYMCGECGKGYKWMDNLRRHQRLECGKPPKYSCKTCKKMFYRRYELTNHMNTKHGFALAHVGH